MKVVADDKIPFLRGVLEPYAEVTYLPGKEITRKAIVNADALIIRTRTKCTGELLNGTGVNFIGTATIGFDHIDTQYCDKNNIFWTNAPGCNSSSVQQYIAAGLLKIASDFRFKLAGKTLGIAGVGNVGSKVEKLAGLLGMEIILNDPPRARKEKKNKFVPLSDLLYNSDIVTLHIPLNVVGEDCTYHFFNDKTFSKMKKGAWFINASRGEVTETQSLKKALDSGKLGGAIIDVWENEPDIDIELMEKTFLSTPHIAGYSTDGKANGTSMIVNSFCKHFDIPLAEWYPGNIPVPENPEIHIDGKGKTDEEVIMEAVHHTYDIDEDNINLRLTPNDFEKQRGCYRVRREFQAFSVRLKYCSEKAKEILGGLGFKLV